MGARTYIIQKLKQLVASYPNMKFTYRFDTESEIHEITATPLEAYYSEKYEDAEISICDDFSKKYPLEGIVFTTEGEEILTDAPIIFEINGDNFIEFEMSFNIEKLIELLDVERVKEYGKHIPISTSHKVVIERNENKEYQEILNEECFCSAA